MINTTPTDTTTCDLCNATPTREYQDDSPRPNGTVFVQRLCDECARWNGYIAAQPTPVADPAADLRARFAPSVHALLAANGAFQTFSDLEEVYAAIALPGKSRGIWITGQRVMASQTVQVSRQAAVALAEQMLGGEPGVVAYAVIDRDGEWAVFEW